jgi:hypothetical protein
MSMLPSATSNQARSAASLSPSCGNGSGAIGVTFCVRQEALTLKCSHPFIFAGMKLTAILLDAGIALTLAAPASPAIPRVYKNCTELNKKYPHGVGRAGARDKTTGDPVTTFKRSTRLYRIAMGHNSRLDRDKDGIACEKK